MKKHYWLSFADADLPKGSQFLGACVVVARDAIKAVQKAHKLKINPGGEVAIVEMKNAMGFPVNKLMTADEIKSIEKEQL